MKTLTITLLLASSFVAGCGDRNPTPIRPKNFIDEAVTTRRPITALGVAGHAATKDLWVTEGTSSRPRHPGGFVVRSIAEESPLAGKIAVGDVLYRVGERDVPNVEDPTVGLIRLLEEAADLETGAVSEENDAADGTVELGFLRRGRAAHTTVELSLASLDEGLPGLPPRIRAMADGALDALARLQTADGGFPTAAETADARLLVASTAGLAFLAAGADLEAGARAPNVRLCFEAVRRELDATTQAEPDGAGAVGLAMATLFLGELLGHGPKPGLLPVIPQALAQLIARQGEDGGFAMADDAATLGYSDRTFATNLALLAIGVAERAGVQADAEVVERGCGFLKAQTNDGAVVYSTAEGFDRRLEAGRAAGAAIALRALNCSPADPFFSSLVDYHRPLANDIVEAPRGTPWHFFCSAVLANQAGIGSRLTFHHDQKIRLVAWQRADGTFAAPTSGTPYRFEVASDGDALRTALGAIVLLLPDERLPLLLAQTHSPMQPRRDGDGKVVEEAAGPGPGDAPPGAKVMQFGSLEEAREFLESMGVDPDSIEKGDAKKKAKKGG